VVAVRIHFTEGRQFREFEFLYLTNFYMIIIDAVLNSPIDEIIPHFGSFLQIKLAGAEEPEEVHVIKLLKRYFFDGSNVDLDPLEGLQLIIGTIAWKSEVKEERYPEYYFGFYFFFPPNQDMVCFECYNFINFL
jgi:hypothetical protein